MPAHLENKINGRTSQSAVSDMPVNVGAVKLKRLNIVNYLHPVFYVGVYFEGKLCLQSNLSFHNVS
jgi:hypothetical protein